MKSRCEAIAEAIKATGGEANDLEAEAISLGAPVPWKARMDVEADQKRASILRLQGHYWGILAMSPYLLAEEQNKSGAEFGTALASTSAGRNEHDQAVLNFPACRRRNDRKRPGRLGNFRAKKANPGELAEIGHEGG